MRIAARNVYTQLPVALTVENERISRLESIPDDPNLPWVAPSIFDPQINGCLGHGFVSSRLNSESIGIITAECVRHGIGGYCPTLITNSYAAILAGFETLSRAIEADRQLSRRLPCFHLEGPFLSDEDGPRGAHPKQYTRDPNWNEFQHWQDAAGGRIRMVTIAPERNGAIAFIEKATAAGVVIAIGHTAANRTQIRDAVAAGARTSTHLGNGSHAHLPRHDNYIWEQLACDSLWASIISDGHHLPGSLIKTFVRAKTVSRLLLTCDAGNLAGLPPGRYSDWGQELEVLPGGKIVVPGTPFLAGSGLFTDTCIATVIKMAGVSLADAISMASIRPRELLGLPVPRLEAGEPADLMVFNWDGSQLEVLETV